MPLAEFTYEGDIVWEFTVEECTFSHWQQPLFPRSRLRPLHPRPRRPRLSPLGEEDEAEEAVGEWQHQLAS